MKKITLLFAVFLMAFTTTVNAQNYGLKTTGTFGDGFSSNEIEQLLSSQTAFTIEFWYKIETFKANAWIFQLEASSTNRIGLLTPGADSGGIYVRIGDGTNHGQQPFWNTDVKKSEGWNHIALTFDAGTVKLYVNGLERTGGGISGAYPATTGDLSGKQFQIGWTTEAVIDELRITKGTALATINTAKSATPANFDTYFDFNTNERPTGAAASNTATVNIGSDATVLGQINNFGTTFEVTDNATLSTKSYNKISALKMYPNPATNQVSIQLNDGTSGKVSVYNITGKLIVEETITNQKEANINTSNFAKGVYMVIFESKTAKQVNKLIVK
tara:strand:+ start:12241 stop:13230 length:990 start_codon:yes stop_codon:yes gene_type:complete